ncbi:hypothetical protein MRX96_005119 [Rhipicephalus microplus]
MGAQRYQAVNSSLTRPQQLLGTLEPLSRNVSGAKSTLNFVQEKLKLGRNTAMPLLKRPRLFRSEAAFRLLH